MRFRRLAFVLFVLFLLSFFFLNTWQGFRYERLKSEVELLERDQKDWLERNKKLIAGLAVLASPSRIAELAESELRLEKLDPQAQTKLSFGPAAERPR